MIPTYYDSPERIAALQVAAAALAGTPFFPNSEAPGPRGGIDCVHLLHWLYRESGAVDQVEIPRQTMDWGQHAERSLLIEAFDTWPHLRERFTCVWRRAPETFGDAAFSPPVEAILPGDALCFLAGKVPHHGGAALPGGDVIHTLKSPGAHIMQLKAVVRGWRVLGFLAAIYRPLPR